MRLKWSCSPLRSPRRAADTSRRLAPGSRAMRRALVPLLAVFAGVTGASATTPDWLRTASKSRTPEYPEETRAAVLYSEQVTTVTGSGEISTKYRKAIKILRPEGKVFGTMAVKFDKDTRLTYLRAWCVPADGRDYELKEKDAAETGLFSESLYTDMRAKVMRIPAAEPGSVIGYEYEQKRRPTVLQDTWEFQEEIPVLRARFELHLPASWEYDSFWLNHGKQEPLALGGNGWAWEVQNVAAVTDEPFMPPWRAVAGRLGVSYHAPAGAASVPGEASWQDVGRWYTQLAAGRRQASPEIKQKVAELTANATAVDAKIKALAAFVQRDIRYVAIEIGIGGFVPHPAAVIFANHYGDCKDKVTLLSAMLAEAGVKSYYVLIDHERGVVTPEFPTPMKFDHAILAIQLPPGTDSSGFYAREDDPQLGRLLFFDPTDPYVSIGYLPNSLQANYGLLVTDDGGSLVKLPLLPPTVNRLLRSAKLALAPDGTLYGDVTEVRWGEPAAELRGRLLSLPDAEHHKATEDFLSNFLGGFELRGYQLDGLDDLSGNLVLRYRFVAPGYAQTAGDLLLVRPRVLGTKEERVFDENERQYPVEYPAATLQGDLVDIELPAGYKPDGLPRPLTLDVGAASYKSKVQLDGNTLHYTRSYTVKDVVVPTSKLAELREFYREIAEDENTSAIFKKAQ